MILNRAVKFDILSEIFFRSRNLLARKIRILHILEDNITIDFYDVIRSGRTYSFNPIIMFLATSYISYCRERNIENCKTCLKDGDSISGCSRLVKQFAKK